MPWRRENRARYRRPADIEVIRVRNGGHMQRLVLSACSPLPHCWPSSTVLPQARSPPPDQRRHDRWPATPITVRSVVPTGGARAVATAQGTNSSSVGGASKASRAWVGMRGNWRCRPRGADDLGCPEGSVLALACDGLQPNPIGPLIQHAPRGIIASGGGADGCDDD
jgi:hypothetical protein